MRRELRVTILYGSAFLASELVIIGLHDRLIGNQLLQFYQGLNNSGAVDYIKSTIIQRGTLETAIGGGIALGALQLEIGALIRNRRQH